MRKYILIILLFILIMPFFVDAKTCDNNKVYIKSIKLDDKSESVVELKKPEAVGKDIYLNLSMSEVGEVIKYKVLINNDSNDDYKLDKTNLNLESDYISYSFEVGDNSNIINAKSSKEVILLVEYKKEVPDDKFDNGKYNENNNMTVQLSSGGIISNPKTGVQYYIVLLLVLLVIISLGLIIFKKKQSIKLFLLLFGISILVPVSVYALCSFNVNVESKVEINKKEAFFKIREYDCESWREKEALIKYKVGMTFNSFKDSSYYKSLGDEEKELVNVILKENDGDLGIFIDSLNDYNVYVVDNNLDACVNSIDWPDSKPNMTDEEIEEYNINMERARNQYNQCYLDYKKLFNMNDLIQDSDKVTYRPDFAISCPE